MQQKKLRNIVLAALMSALCVIGSFIKVPGFVTTAALDSAPAFLSAAFLPPMYSAAVGALGHLATALTSGFPMGPLHVLIAIEMAIIVGVFAWLHKKEFNILKWLFAIIANGILCPLPFGFIMSWEFYFAAVPGLLVATIINLILCAILMPIITKVARQMKVTSS